MVIQKKIDMNLSEVSRQLNKVTISLVVPLLIKSDTGQHL